VAGRRMVGRSLLLVGFGLALAGCESTPRPTTDQGTVGMQALRAESARCAALGYTPGSAEMVECMRAAEQRPEADATP